MHFKKLELLGFKSFSEKTVIEFEPGVTAIVGPNGCGKSNVSDAIRWVIGEQSAKSLRGSSMEDVIFSGSADKEALNFAEVSLTLSNDTKILPIDYDEVTITRRLFRSGESEYILNKNAVRLKDIHDLLLGTGIGTESYSVIEQGKMDMILNSKPEDRRVIFEEAAGITKFKSKKKEALRKLEQTDSNLLRINDIIQEVKRQISSVERQAKKAEQYKTEFEKMKHLELSVASQEFLIFDQDRRTKEQDTESLRNEEALCQSAVHDIEGKYSQERSLLHQAEDALQSANSKEVWAAAEIRKTQDRILLNRERVGELLERRGNLTHQTEGAKKRLDELEAETHKLAEEFEKAQIEESAGQQFLATVQQEFDAIEAGARQAQVEQDAVQAAIQQCHRRRSAIENETQKSRSEINGLEHQGRRLKHEEEALLKEILKIDERLHLPLFNSSSSEVSNSLQARLRDFRDRILSLFTDWAQRQVTSWGQNEIGELEKQIERFSDEIGNLQQSSDSRQIEDRHLREGRRKSEEKLAQIAVELTRLTDEENILREKEKEQERLLVDATHEELACAERLSAAQALREERTREKEGMLVRLAETRSQHNSISLRRQKAERDKQWILDSRRGQVELLKELEHEAEESVTKKQALEQDNIRLEQEQTTLGSQRDELLKNVEALRRQREEAAARVAELEKERKEKMTFLDEAKERVHSFQMQSAEIRFAIDRLKERIFNSYQVDLAMQSEAEGAEQAAAVLFQLPEGVDLEQAKQDIQKYREKLNRMGPVNLVAIEEHQEMTQRFEFLTQQEQDLLKAKDDLHKAILKINRTTRELFAETFAKVQIHFKEYYRLLFGGGQAELILQDESDILESGIDIVARPPGKKLQNISLLSGGEKALTAVALLFALFKVKPSPFCVLDEIDAPLDEPNVDRFCGVLKEFISASQFIIITHNKRTMNLADAIYGITMEQTGVSKVVSVRFSAQRTKEISQESVQAEAV